MPSVYANEKAMAYFAERQMQKYFVEYKQNMLQAFWNEILRQQQKAKG